MPTARNLTAPATPAATIPSAGPVAPAVIPAAAAPTVATVAVADQPNGAIAVLPSWATAVPAVPDKLPAGMQTTYVGQLQQNTGKRQLLLSAGVQDGEYYVDDGSTIMPLRPLKFFVCAAEAFLTDMNSSGDIIRASRDVSNRDDRKMNEHVVCVVVLLLPGNVCVPAKVDFRKSAFPAGAAAIAGAKIAAEPDFPKRGDAHRIAAAFPYPFGRMVTTVSVDKRITKSGEAMGKPYFASTGISLPATVSEMEALAKMMQDENFIRQLHRVDAGYRFRVDQIAKLCK